MTRDLTQAQFADQLVKHGIRLHDGSPFGYVSVTDTVSVCRWNAGTRLRTQLAYLLNSQACAIKEGHYSAAYAKAHGL